MQQEVKYTNSLVYDSTSFVFDHVKIRVNEQITLHKQDSWELSYIITGSGTRIIGDKIEAFTKGEVVLIPPQIPHCWLFDELDVDQNNKIENITILFEHDFLLRIIDCFPELNNSTQSIIVCKDAVSFVGNTLLKLQSLLESMIGIDPIERLFIMLQILNLLSQSDESKSVGRLSAESKQNKRMRKLFLYVMNNYQHTITLDEVAQLIELDKSSFCVFFKKMTGKSFVTYLTDYRIEIACQMLKIADMNISEICYASGFRDIPYFNRIFKKLKGITPSYYKKSRF